jgi:hypothetical protein
MSIVHRDVADITELRRLSRSFAKQPHIRIRRRLMRIVAALLAMEVDRRISRIVPASKDLRFVVAEVLSIPWSFRSNCYGFFSILLEADMKASADVLDIVLEKLAVR